MNDNEDSLSLTTMRKVAWRIVPFVALLYVVSFIDRVNVGFAALAMNEQLGLTPAMFGWGAGVFFFGYFIFEVPSNIILHRVGARIWIARVMFTWGLISMATAFVKGPTSFYVARFMLGVAEAGFFPGIILYLTYWFPQRHLAAVTGAFMTAIPIASFIGAPLSGWLLNFNGRLDLAGWQWMFLLEGIPAVLAGVGVLVYLSDRPEKVTWLKPEEREWLVHTLREEAEQKAVRQIHAGSLWRTLSDLRVLGLGLVYFGMTVGLYGVEVWLPTLLKTFRLGNMAIGLLSAVPYVAAVCAMILWARHSDQRRERVWHVAAACGVACAGVFAAAYAGSLVLTLLFLSVAMVGIMAARPPFWALPSQIMSGAAAAGGIALINSVGNLGGFVGPYMIGRAREATGGYSAGLILVGAFLLFSSVLAVVVGNRLSRNAEGQTVARPALGKA